jgi:hypothetical protein
MMMENAQETITDWFADSGRELEAAAAALQLCFWMADKPLPEAAGLAIFLRSIDQLSFVDRVSLPRRVEEAVGVCSDDLELMQALGAQLERLVALQLFLRDMREVILSSEATTFGTRLRALMETDRGLFVNSQILAPTGCDYDYSRPPPGPTARTTAAAPLQPQSVSSPRSKLAAAAVAAVERHNTPEPEAEDRAELRSRRSFTSKFQSQPQSQQPLPVPPPKPPMVAHARRNVEEQEGEACDDVPPVDTHAPHAPLSEMFAEVEETELSPPPVPSQAQVPTKVSAMSAKDRIKQRLGLSR